MRKVLGGVSPGRGGVCGVAAFSNLHLASAKLFTIGASPKPPTKFMRTFAESPNHTHYPFVLGRPEHKERDTSIEAQNYTALPSIEA